MTYNFIEHNSIKDCIFEQGFIEIPNCQQQLLFKKYNLHETYIII